MQTALVCGAGGFIGSHLVKRLRAEGYWVRGVDLKHPVFSETEANHFVIGDLRVPSVCAEFIDQPFDMVYQLAADMGGAGYVFSGGHDAEIMHNSALINLNVLEACRKRSVGKVFFSSSACIYPACNQCDPEDPNCAEDSAYPAAPDSEYGWEKLFSERLYLAYARNHGMSVRIARYHNIFGPEGTWFGGREKAPAAVCRKVAVAPESGEIEIWGDGRQTRSFLYIDECLDATLRLMHSDFVGPVNIGSEEMISIDNLASLVMKIAGKSLTLKHVPGPLGVRGRTSDNRLIRARLGWEPTRPLADGIACTYHWIKGQVQRRVLPPPAEADLNLGPCKFIPHDGGFFSNINFLVGEMYQGRHLYPLYSEVEIHKTVAEIKHFAYLDPGCPNSWFEFFEPLSYYEGDSSHKDMSWVAALPASHGLGAEPEFRVPASTVALYSREDFQVWRKAVHASLGGRVKPVQRIRLAVDQLLARMPGHRIGVHVRHPSHCVEQGRVFFADYFTIIDRLCEEHPSAPIFLATDNDLALAAFAQRYGDRVVWHAGFMRESIDSVLDWAYTLMTGRSDAMGFVAGRGFQTHYNVAAKGGGTEGIRCGREAVIDVFTLAACDDFVCTASNFTLTCAFLNPEQRQHLISKGAR